MTNSNEQANKAEADRAEAVELSDQELENAAGGIIIVDTLVARRFSSFRPVLKLFPGRRHLVNLVGAGGWDHRPH